MPAVKVDKEFRSLIPPLSDEELGQLEKNILADGCRDPLAMWGDLVLDGHNRLKICERHSLPYDTKGVYLEGREAAKVWIIRNQFGRRNLAPFQRAELALKLEPLITERGKEKKRKGGKSKVPQVSVEPIDTQKELAKSAGVSHDTIHKAKVIAEKAPEETKAKLRKGETTINAEYKKINQAQKRETQRKVSLEESKTGKFPVIYADPPWSYSNTGLTGAAADQYPTMATDDICNMPVKDKATKAAVLFLWSTNPLLPDALRVMKAWGFEYKTNFCWVKDKATGIGFYCRGKHELLLIGTRGSFMPKEIAKPESVVMAKRRKHSQKPDEFYDLIESMYDGPFLELFARQNRKGWKAWGNEVV